MQKKKEKAAFLRVSETHTQNKPNTGIPPHTHTLVFTYTQTIKLNTTSGKLSKFGTHIHTFWFKGSAKPRAAFHEQTSLILKDRTP